MLVYLSLVFTVQITSDRLKSFLHFKGFSLSKVVVEICYRANLFAIYENRFYFFEISDVKVNFFNNAVIL